MTDTITFAKQCTCPAAEWQGYMGTSGTHPILCKDCGTAYALVPPQITTKPQISPPPYGPPFTVPSKPPSPAPHWITIAAYLANIGAGDRFVDSNGPGQVLVFIPWADYERTYVPADPSKGRVAQAMYIPHLKVWVHDENRLLRESDRVTHVLVPGEP